MANKELKYTLTEDDFYSQYDIELNGNTYKFDVVLFEGIDEYNSHLEPNEVSIFNKLEKIKHKIFKVVGYDWDIKQINNDINIFHLVRAIEWVGKDYVIRHWPDVIFYEAEDDRLHRIYQRMFGSFGYHYLYETNKHHIFLRDFNSVVEIT